MSPSQHDTPSTERPGAPTVTRRRALALGGLGVVALGVAACSDDGDGAATSTSPAPPSTRGAPSSTAGSGPPDAVAPLVPADFEALGTCLLLPELTPGPFPTIEQLERRDISEGVPGQPLRLGLRVVDTDCAPVAGAAVEVWHTDATGDYSSYADGGGGKDDAEGTTFCRGYQVSDGDGIVELHTIYPGWYPGRAVHLHVRVRVDDDLLLTTQLFFPDDVTAAVYERAPYDAFGLPDTPNAADGFGGDIAGNGTLLTVHDGPTSAGPGTVGLANLGIDR